MSADTFTRIGRAALDSVDRVLDHFLPDGKCEAGEYVALNPRRNDKSLGSFRINTQTGQWSDFATGDKGGDLVSLVAYLIGGSQMDGAKSLANFLNQKQSLKIFVLNAIPTCSLLTVLTTHGRMLASKELSNSAIQKNINQNQSMIYR